MTKGKLYGVGVGPGDPELLTLKAARLLRGCDVVAMPGKEKDKCFAYTIAKGAVPEIDEKEALMVDMPMTKDQEKRRLAYKKGIDDICAKLEEGKDVVFITLGDTSVYSTYLYLHKGVKANGYETEMVPGITSFCAAAAVLETSLCENDDELHVIPGTYKPVEALDYSGVKVFMKNDIEETLKAAKAKGLSVQMVENCGTKDQKVYRSAEEIPYDAGYYSLLIIKEDK